MSIHRAQLLGAAVIYGVMAVGIVVTIEKSSFGPMLAGVGLGSFLGGLILLGRPDLSGRLLGRSSSLGLLWGLAFLGQAACTEHLLSGSVEVVAACVSVACILAGWLLDFRARQRIPRATT